MKQLQRAAWIGMCGLVFLSAGQAPALGQVPADPTAKLDSEPQVSAAQPHASANGRVLTNTLVLAGSVAGIAVPIGTLLAFVLLRTDLPGKRIALAAMVFLLFLPLYVQVGGWEAAFGKLGWLTRLMEQIAPGRELPKDPDEVTGPKLLPLAGMPAVIFVHTMAAIPWVVLIVSAGLRLVRRDEEEVAMLDASGPQVVARIVLPQIAPFVLAAGLLVAIGAAAEMTVTNIYLIEPGEYTLAEQVYMTLQSEPLAEALRQCAPSIAATLLLVAGGWWSVSHLATATERAPADRRQPLIYALAGWRSLATLCVWLPLAAAIGLPLLSLAYKAGTLVVWEGDVPTGTWSALKSATMPWTALWSVRSDVGWTAWFAAAAATFDVALAISVAYFVPSGFWRTALAVTLAALAFALPGPIVGLGIIALMNHDLAGMGWLYERTDLPAILAQAVRAWPVVMLLVLESLSRLPRSTLEAAQLDGAGTWSILWRVVIPQRAAAIAVAWLAGFAVAAGDLAWSILVLRPGVDTLQRRLFGDIHAGADDRVAGVCLAISLVYALFALAMLSVRRFRREIRPPVST